jgi:cytidylate kinase
MNTLNPLEKCYSFINCQLQAAGSRCGSAKEIMPWRAITISRQAGSGGHAIAEKLLEYLPLQTSGVVRRWMIFDRNLVEKVLEDHNLPGRLAKFMPEDRISGVSDTMDELFGLHPASWILVRKISETILHLAEMGNVIVIGRGANVITSKLSHIFHVRLVGSLENRVKHLQEVNRVSAREAARLAERDDLGRRRYLKQYFDKNIDDPLLYHLVINTDLIAYEDAARMIALSVAPKAMAMAA